ncbi:MAG TPA: hypothetical protein DCM08_06670 [Microscillaceae bacterium]|nr:hypothetical protein [Microscillaceae bacterium]
MKAVARLFIFFCFLYAPIAQAQPKRVVKGRLDLRKDTFDHQLIIPLAGDWKYVHQAFLNAEQMQKASKAEYLPVPGEWNKFTWQGQPIPGHNFATYQVEVLLPPHLPDLAIYFPSQGTSYRVYANNKLLKEVGKPATQAADYQPRYENFLHVFSQVPDTLTLTLQIANFSYKKGGMWHEPFIGSFRAVSNWKEVIISSDLFVLGAIAFMALYHLALYWFRPDYKATLYFVVVCLAAITREASLGELLLLKLFPQMPWEMLIKIEYTSLYVGFLFACWFMQYLYPDETNPKAIWLLNGVVAFFSSITLFFPAAISSYTVRPFQITFLIFFFYCFWVMGQAIRNQRKGAPLFTFGMFFLLLTGINDVLYYNYIISTGALMTFGLFIYFFSQMVIMAQRFSRVFNEKESLSQALLETNATLEQKVQARTVELHATIEELNNSNQEIKRTLEVVNHQKERLEELNLEKDGLVEVVAHDLRAPFHQQQGLLNLLERTAIDDEQKKYLDLVAKSCNQGLNLIRDLLVINNAEYEQNDLPVEPVQAAQFIENILNDFQASAQAKNIRLHFDRPMQDFGIYTSTDYLRRILENLLSNALKFSFPDKNIFLQLRQAGQRFTLTVRDEGQGIAPEEMPRLFRKFQKLSARPTAGEDSSGLGLAIVTTLVGKLDGSVAVHSELHQGTTFHLQFPISPEVLASKS